ncbi:hypothetical protein HKD28_12390 [Gluconobacter sp. LMG 1744]|uniref:hypothetical protein n=1 Tax=Gluconobacter cadivus TaxID=2728101 RepID=UPI0018856484|nr:hypothetical protein [Gluconobacter cadivus]MBF0892200.1 hypothetical protein [Gluconobacter cadivus]
MLYRVIIRDLAVAALKCADTMAGENVFVGRSLPIGERNLPALYLQIYEDRGESPGPAQVQFERTSTMGIRGYVSAGTPSKVEALLDRFAEEIELALMRDVTLQAAICQVSEFSTATEVTSEGSAHIGEFKMILGFQYIETYPPDGVPLTEIDATLRTADQPVFAGMTVEFPSE